MTANLEATVRTLILAFAATIPAAGAAFGIDWLRFNVAPAYLRVPFGFIGGLAAAVIWFTCVIGVTMFTARQSLIDCGGSDYGRTRFK